MKRYRGVTAVLALGMLVATVSGYTAALAPDPTTCAVNVFLYGLGLLLLGWIAGSEGREP